MAQYDIDVCLKELDSIPTSGSDVCCRLPTLSTAGRLE